MNKEDTELEQTLREGIAAARAGQKEQARDLLLQVIAQDEEVEAAWLWLSSVVDDPEERQICLENVLTLNPDNAAARAGLDWLAEQGLLRPPELAPAPPAAAEAPRQTPTPVPDAPALAESPVALQPPPLTVEIDPFGCPYCGGSVSGEEPRCDHCRRLATLRSRKRAGGMWLGWLALLFLVLGAAAWVEGFLVLQLAQAGRLPPWLSHTAVRPLIGTALFSPEGLPGELVELAGAVTLINMVLAGLCIIAALGLAFRLRAVYFGSFLLAGLLVMVTGVGLLTGLVGWLSALLRLGLAAFSVKWLVDNAPAFEWETHSYNADVDRDLRTDLDYYNRGLRYREMGFWAKAAAHWQVATRLAPGQAQYRAALANAYAKMGYPAAALAEVDKALAQAPDDAALRAFRDSLAQATSGALNPVADASPHGSRLC